MISNGVDVVSIERIEKVISRNEEAFRRRVLTEAEKKEYPSNEARKAEYLAGRFAAKEAISKALGTGIGGQGVSMTDMEVLRKDSGAPYVQLYGCARKVFEEKGGRSICISISHDGGVAVAFCCIEWEEE
ncbi:MAG: holo-ACP synthase [Clostridiales bacterium]|nr:holo-ACP synthase [Clostridiales bacterium]